MLFICEMDLKYCNYYLQNVRCTYFSSIVVHWLKSWSIRSHMRHLWCAYFFVNLYHNCAFILNQNLIGVLTEVPSWVKQMNLQSCGYFTHYKSRIHQLILANLLSHESNLFLLKIVLMLVYVLDLFSYAIFSTWPNPLHLLLYNHFLGD